MLRDNKGEFPLDLIAKYVLVLIALSIGILLAVKLLSNPLSDEEINEKLSEGLNPDGKDICKKYLPGERIEELDFKRILFSRDKGVCEGQKNYVVFDFTLSKVRMEEILKELAIVDKGVPLALYREDCSSPITFEGVSVELNNDRILFKRHDKVLIENSENGVMICNYVTVCGDNICDPDEKNICIDDCGIPNECSDGLDNDNDGKTDLDDIGCLDEKDNDETNCGDGRCEGGENESVCLQDCRVILNECEDGIDNDNDGKTDLDDIGCLDEKDNDETNCGDNVCEENEEGICFKDCQIECTTSNLVDMVDGGKMMDFMKKVTESPHPIGSIKNKENAEYELNLIKQYGLKNTRFETFSSSAGTGYNVVGELGNGNEVVVVGGHRDTVPPSPGAIDNEAVIPYEAGRVLSLCEDSLKTNIAFVGFDGEERGLWGSKNYVDKHKGENIVAMLNFDCQGDKLATNAEVFRSSDDLGKIADKCCLDYNLPCAKRARAVGMSDHASFERIGVPYIFATVATGSNSCGPNYHKAGDTFDGLGAEQLEWSAKLAVCMISELYMNN